jgi:hypothetical protein
MTAPLYFNISPSNQTGFIYSTQFAFTANVPSGFTSLLWDFGDNNTEYNLVTAFHLYEYPGIYTVSLSACYPIGSIVTNSAEVEVDYLIRDSMEIISSPTSYGTASVMPTEMFVLGVTSCQINSSIGIVLQSINSASLPHYGVNLENKWNFLVPQWRFVNSETNEPINEVLRVNTKPIFDSKGNTVAVSGTASFYYYDDSASTLNPCPLLLVATLSSLHFVNPQDSNYYRYPSYANSEVTRATIAWQINETIPTDLKITENYINEVYPIKWSNVPIPILISCEYNNYISSPSLTGVKVLSYPASNMIGSINPIKVELLSGNPISGFVPEHLYTVEVDGVSYAPSAAPLYFKANDHLGTPCRGFVFTTLTPLLSFDTPITISAKTVAVNGGGTFAFPVGYPIYPHAYISHPRAGKINKFGVVTYSNTECGSVAYYQNLGTVTQGSLDLITAPESTIFNATTYTLSGAGAVYGMAFDPILNRLYAADADQDVIWVYDSGGSSLAPTTSISISSYTGDLNNAPSYISIDQNNNFWVSMFGSLSCLKFDSSLNLVGVAVPNVSYPLSSEDYGSLLLEPPIIETDMNNDVWVCYAHPVNSTLIKYDLSGNELFKCPGLDLNSVPVSLAIDNVNNVWVACRETNTIQCYHSTTGMKLYEFTNYLRPSYITFDRTGNLWITHGLNRISTQNILDATNTTTWKISLTGGNLDLIVNSYTPSEINQLFSANEEWSGLNSDVFDNIWAINKDKNEIYIFKAISPNSTLSVFSVAPTTTQTDSIVNGVQVASFLGMGSVPSAQGAGDWTGNKWYQKYTGSTFSSVFINGNSTQFKVLDLENGIPKIVKVNEEFDTSRHYKSLALPEILHKNSQFFNEFMKAIVGDGNPFTESVGRISYERIANFFSNHGDLDTVEIDQLMSLAKQMSVETTTFADDFPREVERLLNLFSVNKHYLRGQKHYETDLIDVIGDSLTLTDLITAGTTVIMKDKIYNFYQPIYVSPLDSGLTVYPLLSIDIDSARMPLDDNYAFFQYNETEVGYKNNIINWNSPNNTLDYSLSTDEQWYGNDELLELSFNNLLTKRLLID